MATAILPLATAVFMFKLASKSTDFTSAGGAFILRLGLTKFNNILVPPVSFIFACLGALGRFALNYAN